MTATAEWSVLSQDSVATEYSSEQVAMARDILARVAGARRAKRLYPDGHPALREHVVQLHEVLSRYHTQGVDVGLTFYDGEVFLGDQLLADESVLFERLITELSSQSDFSVAFERGLSVDELERAMPLLAGDDPAGVAEHLSQAPRDNHSHVVVTRVVRQRAEGGGDSEEESEPAQREQLDPRVVARRSYMGALDLLRDMDGLVGSGRVLRAGQMRRAVSDIVQNMTRNRFAMLELSGLKDLDEYTFFHSVNVAILSLAVGTALSSDPRFLASLAVGALMHDVGKMELDPGVINKNGALDDEEWGLLQLHPLHGAEMAAATPGFDPKGIVQILEHHMRHSLDGYPTSWRQRPQHLTSRIVAVADAYDAMTSRRSYSTARRQDEAIVLLTREAGTAFDPAVVRVFIQVLGVYPPRTVVRLSTGEVGVVTRPGESDVRRPHVRVFADPGGSIVAPRDVDLGVPGAPSVAGCIDSASLNVDVADYL